MRSALPDRSKRSAPATATRWATVEACWFISARGVADGVRCFASITLGSPTRYQICQRRRGTRLGNCGCWRCPPPPELRFLIYYAALHDRCDSERFDFITPDIVMSFRVCGLVSANRRGFHQDRTGGPHESTIRRSSCSPFFRRVWYRIVRSVK